MSKFLILMNNKKVNDLKYYLLNKCSKITSSTCTLKAGNTSENLLNEIGQIIYSLFQEKEVT